MQKFSVKFLQFPHAETAQYVKQWSFCFIQGISFLITPATIKSPIYIILWMCLVRYSGLFIFQIQILIWSYSVALLSQLSLAWIQDEELQTNTHTHTSVQYSDWFLFLQCPTACLTILCRFLSYKWHVRPILAVSWQPHCLLSHISAAGSVAPCFDLPLSQRTVSSPGLVLGQCGMSKVPTTQLHHPAQYTFFIYTWHTAVFTTVV